MNTKTDSAAEVGMHVFERAGLGKAPFKCTGFSQKLHVAGDTCKPGGSCDYCGTSILLQCHIQGADGREFKVGSDCVNKTGDAGLIEQYKRTPEYRKHQRDLVKARGDRARKECTDLVELNASALKAMPSQRSYYSVARGETRYDDVLRGINRFGNSNGPAMKKYTQRLISEANAAKLQ